MKNFDYFFLKQKIAVLTAIYRLSDNFWHFFADPNADPKWQPALNTYILLTFLVGVVRFELTK